MQAILCYSHINPVKTKKQLLGNGISVEQSIEAKQLSFDW